MFDIDTEQKCIFGIGEEESTPLPNA